MRQELARWRVAPGSTLVDSAGRPIADRRSPALRTRRSRAPCRAPRPAGGATPGSVSARPFRSTSQCASPSSLTRRSKPRIASRATRQLRCTRTKRWPNSCLEPRQRFLEQELALVRADRDVLELGLQVDHVVDRHEHDARALGHRQETARVGRQLRDAARPTAAGAAAPSAAPAAAAARAPASPGSRPHCTSNASSACSWNAVVKTTTGGRGSLSRWRASSMPSMSGMWMSVSTRSGGADCIRSSASRPLAASPTTAMRQRRRAVVEQLAQPPPRGRLVVDDHHAERRVSHARLRCAGRRCPARPRRARCALRAVPRARRPGRSAGGLGPVRHADVHFVGVLEHLATRATPRRRNAARAVRARCRAPSCCPSGGCRRSRGRDCAAPRAPRPCDRKMFTETVPGCARRLDAVVDGVLAAAAAARAAAPARRPACS